MNLSIVEGAIEGGHQAADQLISIRGNLHAYMGVKAKIYEIDASLKEQFSNFVTKGKDDQSFAINEFRKLAAQRN